ncbi:MAG: hypothetical protein KatS3mg013_1700 [Actinomycetota bacterium]|nr:MAG: hypothetical protein KatS3mg013_1700 [Actinomycetota bacterium]
MTTTTDLVEQADGALSSPERARPPHFAYALKRAVLGRPLPTAALAHERLGKPTALAVFASDNLSSVAYATEEILRVTVPVVGAAAFALLMPITVAMLGVLAILVFSYRQTIKAYPSAGGAYVVTRDNFGLMVAQVAGVSLLTDYVLTVSVSIAAGTAAIYAAFPAAFPWRVPISIALIWLVAWGNLRGVRESGRIFSVPTYFFIAMMALLLGGGALRALTGSLHPLPLPDEPLDGTGAVGLFLVLHAFASGGAAVTGVEAISNGVPAFRPPEWRNARTTLVWMGSLLGVMFLGLSWLSTRLHAVPSEGTTVIAEVGRAVFGRGPLGVPAFLALQVATTLILVMAANTSFADFPRLASFQASDEFMPRWLTKRGHRLVYSNGIVALAAIASALVIAFDADTHRLIPLYALGVFTSFTLSQAGMARHHLRLREPGWRLGLFLNGLGALTTLVVAVVVGLTKFSHGAWAIIVLVPVFVVTVVRMNRRYQHEHEVLAPEPWTRDPARPARALVVVERLDHDTEHAIRYAKTIAPGDVTAVHLDRGGVDELRRAWSDAGLGAIQLRVIRGSGDDADRLAGFVGGLPDDRPLVVLLAAPLELPSWERLSAKRTGGRLARALEPYPHATVTIVHGHGRGRPERSGEPRGIHSRPLHSVVVLVDAADRATARAVRFARSLTASEVRALHAAADPTLVQPLVTAWLDLRMPVPLDVIECYDRNVARAIEQHVVALTDPRREVTVVMARRDFPSLLDRVLHDRSSRPIARAIGRYPHIHIAILPYAVSETGGEGSARAWERDAQPAGSATQR